MALDHDAGGEIEKWIPIRRGRRPLAGEHYVQPTRAMPEDNIHATLAQRPIRRPPGQTDNRCCDPTDPGKQRSERAVALRAKGGSVPEPRWIRKQGVPDP